MGSSLRHWEETAGHFSLAAPLAQASKKIKRQGKIKDDIQNRTPCDCLLTHRSAIVGLTFFSAAILQKMWEGAAKPIIRNMKTGVLRGEEVL